MTVILGVHGVGNDRRRLTDTAAAKGLATTWAGALSKSLVAAAQSAAPPTVDMRVAYYAPQLRGEIPQGADDPDNLNPEAQAMIRAWIDLLDPPEEIAAGRTAAPLRYALEWVASRFGLDNTLTRLFTTVFFREVAAYFDPDNSYPRIKSRNVFLEAVTTYRPRIVIAHSLGSVITYEALWSRPDIHIDLLLTLGSPLGMPDVVFPRLEPGTAATGWGQRPPGVRTWINIADRGDLIAIPRNLPDRFRGIDNNLATSIHAFDFHKVVNYLQSPETVDAISPYLAPPPTHLAAGSRPE